MVSTRLMSSVGVNGVTTHSEAPNIQPGTSRQSARIQAVERSTDPLNLNNIDNHEDEIITSTEPASSQRTIFFLDLPQEIIEKIFSYLSFKNVAHLRPVSHAMDQICGNVLNATFQKLQKQMLIRFQNIKAKMPRRESARRNHPLACESDIIETLHMRLTLLQMSFGKHIERRHCCFFAGEVLDEVYRILHYIKKTTKLQRPYKVTDELFDLSSMAMEYFKEHIEPRLPEIAYFTSDFLDFTATGKRKTYMCLDSSPLGAGSSGEQKDDETPIHQIQDPEPTYMPTENLPQSNMVLRKRIRKIKQGMKRYNSQLSLLRQDLRSCKRKTAEQQKQIAEQQRQLAEQQKQTLEYATRLDENDKKNEETSRKFGTLLQELNKCKTELQYWRSKSPAMPPVCKGCGNVFTPVPAEDLQILVNQGIRPEGLGLLPEYSQESQSTEEIQIQPVSGIEAPIQSPLPLTSESSNVAASVAAAVPIESCIDISPPQSPSQHTRQQGTKRKQPATSAASVPTTSSKRLPKRKK